MTYIEFFDKTATENICASLLAMPQRIVLIGHKSTEIHAHAKRYQQLFSKRGEDVEIICRTVGRNNLQNIVDELTKLVLQYEDCVFDVTGGEELYLVAVGIISQLYKEKNIKIHRYNMGELPELTVEENIFAYGGKVVYANTPEKKGTYQWRMEDGFEADFALLWNLCKKDVKLWNSRVRILEAVEANKTCKKEEFVFIKDFIENLKQEGLLLNYQYAQEKLYLTYKNKQIKACLTKAGVVLELKIFFTAQKMYDSVLTGVLIDWDGKRGAAKDNLYETENEIDVMMMHGIIPVFVSCKNGRVEMDELYKLNTVAERFGGRYAKKVLVTTALQYDKDFSLKLKQRAADMHIRIVENIQNMEEEELIRVVGSFWRN